MKRSLLALVAGALLLPLASARLAAQAPPLAFFNNYFVTGDYEVGGVSLWRKGVDGRATAALSVPNLPTGVDIVAAFLYVQTAERVQWSGIDHARFNGHDLGPGNNSLAKALNWDQATRPCWSVAIPGGRRLVTYRADVLRFLPLVTEGDDRGKFDANGPHTIELPDYGYTFGDDDELGIESGGHTGARAVGASLVVLYRDPSKPFRGVVIYDGGHTKQAFSTMTLGLAGWYQAAASAGARLTPVVGDGRPYLSERVRVNGAVVATNPFVSGAGPKWDNPTLGGFPVTAPGATLEVTPNGLLSDCVSVSAVLMSVNVQDSDGDGLLDVWETAGEETPVLLDPVGQALPALGAMGAEPNQPDLFIEIGAMQTAATTYGSVSKPAHTHLPGLEALQLVGDAFANAPTGAIRVHFDVGPTYPIGTIQQEQYLIRGSGLARGGELIAEQATVCSPGIEPYQCQFSAYPGTVGWKSGFRFLRDEILAVPASIPPTADPEEFCDLPGAGCTRRFDRNRAQSFHYALFAHAVGLPESEDPLHPDFHVPRTNTGIGDFPGGDLMITLGAFNDVDGLPIGTPFMQGSTLMHELGHNFERRHGGGALEPNCKPTYYSVMNYLYQLRGLLDNGGSPHLDFARAPVGPHTVDEAGLPSLSIQPYRLGWYAPLLDSYLAEFYPPTGTSKLPTRYCNGAEFPGGTLPLNQIFVRVDAPTKEETIDWAADGNPANPAVTAQDVNFNGRLDGPPPFPALSSADDWGAIRLNQLATRRNVGALFTLSTPGGILDAVGPLSVDVGKGDLGKGDLGKGDLGKGDLGKGDLGKGDLGKGDLGKGDLGKGDLGKGDLGGGDLFDGDPNNPSGELDFETFISMGSDPAYEFSACVIGETCPPVDLPEHDVLLTWTPATGGVASYTAFRAPGTGIPDESLWIPIGTVSSAATLLQLIDDDNLVNGAAYTYFVVATYTDGTTSPPSNPVTITAINDPLVAANDGYSTPEDTTLSVPAATGVLANDSDGDDPPPYAAELVSGPATGTLTLFTNGAFNYVPAPNASGSVSFTYKAKVNGTFSNIATVTITVTAVNDIPVAAPDTYSMNQGTTLTIPAAGVLANDTDVEGSALTAGSATAPAAGGTLVLNPNGSFSYTPPAAFSGTTTFTYKASDGTASSSAATVTINVAAVGYGFINVKNLPPAPGVTFRPSPYGTPVEFRWQFTKNGALVASADALPSVTITGPGGYNQTFTPSNCILFGFSFEYYSSLKKWEFVWKPRNAAVGTYYVVVKSGKTGQSFPAVGGFPVVFSNY